MLQSTTAEGIVLLLKEGSELLTVNKKSNNKKRTPAIHRYVLIPVEFSLAANLIKNKNLLI